MPVGAAVDDIIVRIHLIETGVGHQRIHADMPAPGLINSNAESLGVMLGGLQRLRACNLLIAVDNLFCSRADRRLVVSTVRMKRRAQGPIAYTYVAFLDSAP